MSTENLDEWADPTLYAAVRAVAVLAELENRSNQLRSDTIEGDRTASILTFRVRFDSASEASGAPEADELTSPLHQRKAN